MTSDTDTAGAAGVETRPAAHEQPVVAAPDMLRRGHSLGRYLVLEPLGAGGMGVVYLAYDPELDRRVAIKLLSQRERNNAATQARAADILSEGRTIAKLAHRNIVRVFDIGRVNDDVFIAMEYVAGPSLAEWIRDEQPSPTEIMRTFVAAGQGLSAAHESGIVHGDFKPRNTMIDTHGEAVVLDFGLARAVTLERTDNEEVSEGPDASVSASQLGGTPAYMAPEQHLGQPATTASDQFSFCVALYEALAGRRPWSGQTAAALGTAVLEEPPADPPAGTLDARTWRVLRRGLSAAPQERYPSLQGLLADLQPSSSRARWPALAGAAAIAAVTAGAVLIIDDEGPCTDAEAQLADTWSAADRERLRPETNSRIAWDNLADRLDAYAGAWTEEWVDACRRTHVDGSQSSELLDRRMLCLNKRRSRLHALVEGIETATADALLRAPALAEGLADPTQCADIERLLATTPLPEDPGERERVAALEARLDTLDMMTELHNRPQDALRDLQGVHAEAETLAYAPLLAHVELIRGDALSTAGEHRPALEAYRLGIRHAEAGGDDAMALHLAKSLMFITGRTLHEPEVAQAWTAYAEAKLARLGNPGGKLRMLFLISRAAVERIGGDRHSAIATSKEALVLAEQAAVPSDANVGTLYNNLGIALGGIDDYDAALEAHRKGLALREGYLGPHHPSVGASLYNIAKLQADRRALAEADAALDRAAEIFAALPIRDQRLVHVLVLRGVIAAESGELELAREHFEAAVARGRETFGPDNPELSAPLVSLGQLLRVMDRPREAMVPILESIQIVEARYGTNYAPLAHDYAELGHVYRLLGDETSAKARYEHALGFDPPPQLRRELEDALTRLKAPAPPR